MFELSVVQEDIAILGLKDNPRREWSVAQGIAATEWLRVNGSVVLVDKARRIFAAESAYIRNEITPDTFYIFPHFRLATLKWSHGGGQCDGQLVEVTDQAEVARRKAFNDAARRSHENAARARAEQRAAAVASLLEKASSQEHSVVRYVPRELADYRKDPGFVDVLFALARNQVVRDDQYLRQEVWHLARQTWHDEEIEAIFAESEPAPTQEPTPEPDLESAPEPEPTPDTEPAPEPDPEPGPEIVNLTPHELNIRVRDASQIISVPPSGTVARCTEEREELPSPLPNIRVTRVKYGTVTGLPDPEPGKVFVVSAIVLNALGGTRPDVFCPGPGIRDAEGRIVGCDGLSQL